MESEKHPLSFIVCLALSVPFWATAQSPKPPIEIPLTLEKDSYVTIVIDNDEGDRVRNLVSETFYPAGSHTLYWDGMDDHGQQNVGPHGNYTKTGSLVSSGQYRVRGLIRDKVDLRYEFTPYAPQSPSWRTAGATGQWMADHTPPSSALYVPGDKPHMLLGSSLAEGGHGLIWTDLQGKKIKGVTGIGSDWAGAVRLCRDAVAQPDSFIAYGLGASRFGEVSLVGIGDKRNKTLFRQKEKIKHHRSHYIVDYPVGGLAVYDAMAAISFPKRNEILLLKIDTEKATAEKIGAITAKKPMGLCFDSGGRLYVIADQNLYRVRDAKKQPNELEAIIQGGLEEPQEITMSEDGQIYISDHGSAHQIKVFDTDGKLLRTIGETGKPACGPYRPRKMHYPMSMALTPDGQLWVAEEDYQPKRVSVWSAKDGQFIKAFYGSTEYGGGGKLDPQDKNRFYYFGMEFALDWYAATNQVKNIFFRRDNPGNLLLPTTHGSLGAAPETPVYINGHQYLTNTYNSAPTMGPVIAGVWRMDDGIATPVAALGQANYWDIFKAPEYRDKIPEGINIEQVINQQWVNDKQTPYENSLLFVWSDLNNNQEIEVDEVSFRDGKVASLNQNDGLTFITADGLSIAPDSFTQSGVPVYDLEKAEITCPLGVPIKFTTIIPGINGDYALVGSSDYFSTTQLQGAVCGITRSGNRWYYPNQWHSLHASQSYPIDRTPLPGDLIGTTKVIGPSFTIGNTEELWALNANSGQIYLFTIDGLFVASLFKHGYFSQPNPLQVNRGMQLGEFTSDGEGFYQTITATSDGNVYLQAMNHTSSIIRVDGLDSIHRIKPFTVEVSQDQLNDCREWFSKAEIARQAVEGRKVTKVPTGGAITVDGKLHDWADADWQRIDDRTEGALKITDEKLYAAWKTLHPNLIHNAGADPWHGMFKTGGALDVMISTSGNTSLVPKVGDQRLLVSRVGDKIRAIHYEQKSERQGFTEEIASPNRSITFDHIRDMSNQVELAEAQVQLPYQDTNIVRKQPMQRRNGTAYELSIPLSLLSWQPKPGKYTCDIGILLGNGTKTIKRLYWSNKNTTMLFDAPEESLLKPGLWGELQLFKPNSFAETLKKRGEKVEVLIGGKGLFKIDSSKLTASEPCAAVDWSGQGQLTHRSIGRNGYVLFRHGAEGWQDQDTPLVHLSDSFSFSSHQPGKYKDGLYAGSKKIRKHLYITLNGEPTGDYLGAGLWSRTKKTQKVSWDIRVSDKETHQLTLLFGSAAPSTLYLSPLNNPEEQRNLINFSGTDSDKMAVAQFSFQGDVRLTLEQPPYTDLDLEVGREPANITGIFID